MRKLLAALVAVIFCCSTAFTQAVKAKSAFGVKGGLNLSSFRLGTKYSDYEADIKVGFVLGAFVNIPLSSRFTLQPEFLYSQMGAKPFSNLGHTTLYYNYFSVPLLVKYKAFRNFNVVAGPEMDFLIRARQVDYLNHKTTVTNDIKDFDFAVTGGFEFILSKNAVVMARYIHGTQDVSTTPEDNTVFNQGVQATFGWKLLKRTTKRTKKAKAK